MNGRGDLAVIFIVLVVAASATAMFALKANNSTVQEHRCVIDHKTLAVPDPRESGQQ